MPPCELDSAIAERAAVSQHGQAVEISGKISRNLLCRGVSLVGVFSHRLGYNGIQIGGEFRGGSPRSVTSCITASGDRRGFLRLTFADNTDGFIERLSRDSIRQLTRQQFVENDPEGVDVCRGGEGFSAYLFRTGVGGR